VARKRKLCSATTQFSYAINVDGSLPYEKRTKLKNKVFVVDVHNLVRRPGNTFTA
jgi:hypothetical protein